MGHRLNVRQIKLNPHRPIVLRQFQQPRPCLPLYSTRESEAVQIARTAAALNYSWSCWSPNALPKNGQCRADSGCYSMVNWCKRCFCG